MIVWPTFFESTCVGNGGEGLLSRDPCRTRAAAAVPGPLPVHVVDLRIADDWWDRGASRRLCRPSLPLSSIPGWHGRTLCLPFEG